MSEIWFFDVDFAGCKEVMGRTELSTLLLSP